MKLALGTAQLGLKYGIANSRGQVSLEEADRILSLAADSGVSIIDTAIDYGDSETVLGRVGVSGFRIITKVGLPPTGEPPGTWLRREVNESLHRLKIESLHGLLLHRPTEVIQHPLLAEWIEELGQLQSLGLVEKVGVSIYSPSELEHLVGTVPVDIVQAPLNVLDQRLASTGWLRRLQASNIEVHARSAFLQGLLLMKLDELPAYFSPWQKELEDFHDWLEQTGLPAAEACVRYVASLEEVDKVVVGVDSAAQFAEVASYFAKPTFLDVPEQLSVKDELLINPANWSL